MKAAATSPRVAVIGAGMAGAACARALADAGLAVEVFDKSRGVGGRMATRRGEWVDAAGCARPVRWDHGAPGFGVSSDAFAGFVEQGCRSGWLAPWSPRMDPAGLPLDRVGERCVAVPDMPAACRALLHGLTVHTGHTLQALQPVAGGWQLQLAEPGRPMRFDQVLLAIPPAQAVPLLSPHRPDWARHAAGIPMQPCWTLLAVADAPRVPLHWDAARPPTGPLAWIARDERRPGRGAEPADAAGAVGPVGPAGPVHWVAHASPAWSRRHLEADAATVAPLLQAALADWLREAPAWRHVSVHRWRYAQLQGPAKAWPANAWWDAGRGLGACGDALGGGGVEGAWLSGRALAAAVLGVASGDRPSPTDRRQRPATVRAPPFNLPTTLPTTTTGDHR